MPSLGDLLVTVGAEISGFHDAMQQVSSDVSSINSQLSGMIGWFDGFTEKLGELGKALGVADGLAELGKSALEVYANIQKAEISLTALTGSADTAIETIGRLKDMAMQDALAFPALLQADQRMVAFGFSASQIPELLQGIADAAAATDRDFESVATAADRIALSGTASARTLATLGLSMQDLGAAMGEAATTSNAAITAAFKALDEGSRVDVITEALQKYQGVAEQVAHGIAGQWQDLKNQVEFTLDDIGQALAPIASDAMSVFKDLLTAAELLASGLIKVGDGFQWLFDKADAADKKLGTTSDDIKTASLVTNGFLAAAFEVLAAKLGLTVDKLDLAHLAMLQTTSMLGAMGLAADQATNSATNLSTGAQAVVDAQNKASDAYKKAKDAYSELSAAYAAGKPLTDGTVVTMQDVTRASADAEAALKKLDLTTKTLAEGALLEAQKELGAVSKAHALGAASAEDMAAAQQKVADIIAKMHPDWSAAQLDAENVTLAYKTMTMQIKDLQEILKVTTVAPATAPQLQLIDLTRQVYAPNEGDADTQWLAYYAEILKLAKQNNQSVTDDTILSQQALAEKAKEESLNLGEAFKGLSVISGSQAANEISGFIADIDHIQQSMLMGTATTKDYQNAISAGLTKAIPIIQQFGDQIPQRLIDPLNAFAALLPATTGGVEDVTDAMRAIPIAVGVSASDTVNNLTKAVGDMKGELASSGATLEQSFAGLGAISFDAIQRSLASLDTEVANVAGHVSFVLPGSFTAAQTAVVDWGNKVLPLMQQYGVQIPQPILDGVAKIAPALALAATQGPDAFAAALARLAEAAKSSTQTAEQSLASLGVTSFEKAQINLQGLDDTLQNAIKGFNADLPGAVIVAEDALIAWGNKVLPTMQEFRKLDVPPELLASIAKISPAFAAAITQGPSAFITALNNLKQTASDSIASIQASYAALGAVDIGTVLKSLGKLDDAIINVGKDLANGIPGSLTAANFALIDWGTKALAAMQKYGPQIATQFSQPLIDAIAAINPAFADAITQGPDAMALALQAMQAQAKDSALTIVDAWASIGQKSTDVLSQQLQYESDVLQKLLDNDAPLQAIYQAKINILATQQQIAVAEGDSATHILGIQIALDNAKIAQRALYDEATGLATLYQETIKIAGDGWKTLGNNLGDAIAGAQSFNDAWKKSIEDIEKKLAEMAVNFILGQLKDALVNDTNILSSWSGILDTILQKFGLISKAVPSLGPGANLGNLPGSGTTTPPFAGGSIPGLGGLGGGGGPSLGPGGDLGNLPTAGPGDIPSGLPGDLPGGGTTGALGGITGALTSSLTSAITGIVGAIGSVFTGIETMVTNNKLAVIEGETRYTMIYTLQILEDNQLRNTILYSIHSALIDYVSAHIDFVLTELQGLHADFKSAAGITASSAASTTPGTTGADPVLAMLTLIEKDLTGTVSTTGAGSMVSLLTKIEQDLINILAKIGTATVSPVAAPATVPTAAPATAASSATPVSTTPTAPSPITVSGMQTVIPSPASGIHDDAWAAANIASMYAYIASVNAPIDATMKDLKTAITVLGNGIGTSMTDAAASLATLKKDLSTPGLTQDQVLAIKDEIAKLSNLFVPVSATPSSPGESPYKPLPTDTNETPIPLTPEPFAAPAPAVVSTDFSQMQEIVTAPIVTSVNAVQDAIKNVQSSIANVTQPAATPPAVTPPVAAPATLAAPAATTVTLPQTQGDPVLALLTLIESDLTALIAAGASLLSMLTNIEKDSSILIGGLTNLIAVVGAIESESQSSLGYQSKILDSLQLTAGSGNLIQKTLLSAVDDLASLLAELQAFHAEFHIRFAPIPAAVVKADAIPISAQIQNLASALEIGDLSSRFAALRVPAITPTIAPAVNTPSAQPMIINNFTINDATDPAKVASAVASYLKGVSPWFT